MSPIGHFSALAMNALSVWPRTTETLIHYVYPGTIDVNVGAGIMLQTRGESKDVELGSFLGKGEVSAAMWMDDALWKWQSKAAARRAQVWVKHVMVADLLGRPQGYEFEGELVLVGIRIPSRNVESLLLQAGFGPSLATWRAKASDERRRRLPEFIAWLENDGPEEPRSSSLEAAASKSSGEVKELRDRAQHVWMRWYALFKADLATAGRTYQMRGRPTLDDRELVLKYRHPSSGAELALRFDVAGHPLHHKATAALGDESVVREALAWAEYPEFVTAVGDAIKPRSVARKAASPGSAAKPSAKPTPTEVAPKSPLPPEDFPRKAEEIGGALTPKTRSRRGGKVSRGPEPAAKEAQTASPRSSAATWMQAVSDAFEREPGYRLEISERGQQGHVVAIFPEGAGVEDAVVSIDLEAGEIEDVRWLSGRLTRTEQDEILDRLGSAVMTANKAETGEPVSPIDALIAMMERRGRILGADPDRTRIQDPQGHLARVLAELAEPSASTPAELMQWLERADLSTAADLVSKFRSGDGPGEVDALGRELWKAAVGYLSVGGVRREGARWRVPCESLYTDKDGQVRLLARRLLASGEYFLLPIAVRSVHQEPQGGITICEVVDENESLEPTDVVYILEREPAEYIELHTRIREFLVEVERTPERLQDVRRLLYWTAAMIETPRCQGAHRGAVRRAFAQAKGHYDDARLHLARGNPVVAFQRVHEALRRLSAAAAAMAEACAEGQLPLTGQGIRGPSLEPSEADSAVLGELARFGFTARTGEARAVPEEPPSGQKGRSYKVILDGDIRYSELKPVPAGAKAVKWLRNLLRDIRPVVKVGTHEYRDPVVREHGDVVTVVYADNRSHRTLTLTAMPLAGYAGRPYDGPVLLSGEIRSGTSVDASFSDVIVERTTIKDASDEDLKKWFSTLVPPVLVHKVEAVYPVGVTTTADTTVTLAVRVEADGHVGWVGVLTSGGAAFDTAALDAVRQWRFTPARQGGVALATMIRVPVTFPARQTGREREARDEIDDLARERGMTREDYLAELEVLELEQMNAEGGARRGARGRGRRAAPKVVVYDPGDLLGKKNHALHGDHTYQRPYAAGPRRGDSSDPVAHAREALTRAGINIDPAGLRVVGRLGEYRAPNATARDLARRTLRDAGFHTSVVRDRLLFSLRQP